MGKVGHRQSAATSTDSLTLSRAVSPTYVPSDQMPQGI